jgi:sugar lactone lactonase YvrE
VTLATVNSPIGIDYWSAVDANYVYFVDAVGTTGTVRKVPIGGGATTILASNQNRPVQLFLGGDSNVYWTNTNGGEVMKVSKTGGTATTISSGLSYPWGIVRDSNVLVACNGTSRASPWSSTDEVIFIANGATSYSVMASGWEEPYAIQTDGTNVYWTDMGASASAGNIRWTPIGGGNGGAVKALASGLTYPIGLALDSGNLYFPNGDHLSTVATSGGSVTDVVSGMPQNVQALSIDAVNNYIYFTVASGGATGSIRKVPEAGGTVTVLTTAIDNPNGIVADTLANGCVYWTNQGDGTVKKIAK